MVEEWIVIGKSEEQWDRIQDIYTLSLPQKTRLKIQGLRVTRQDMTYSMR